MTRRAFAWLHAADATAPVARNAPGQNFACRSLKSDHAGRNNEDGDEHAEELTIATQTETITVCRLSELPEGQMRLIEADGRKIGVFHCTGGELYAIEDRCSHDDGPLAEGEFDLGSCTVECPRHGSLFDLRTGKPRTLPAYRPVETFEVRVDDDEVKLEL